MFSRLYFTCCNLTPQNRVGLRADRWGRFCVYVILLQVYLFSTLSGSIQLQGNSESCCVRTEGSVTPAACGCKPLPGKSCCCGKKAADSGPVNSQLKCACGCGADDFRLVSTSPHLTPLLISQSLAPPVISSRTVRLRYQSPVHSLETPPPEQSWNV